MKTKDTSGKVQSDWVKEFNKEFVSSNNRGIVTYQEHPVFRGECEDCGKKFHGSKEIEEIRFGHVDCPVKNKKPHDWIKQDKGVPELKEFIKQQLTKAYQEGLEDGAVKNMKELEAAYEEGKKEGDKRIISSMSSTEYFTKLLNDLPITKGDKDFLIEEFLRAIEEGKKAGKEEILRKMLEDFKYIDENRKIEGSPNFVIGRNYFYDKLKESEEANTKKKEWVYTKFDKPIVLTSTKKEK